MRGSPPVGRSSSVDPILGDNSAYGIAQGTGGSLWGRSHLSTGASEPIYKQTEEFLRLTAGLSGLPGFMGPARWFGSRVRLSLWLIFASGKSRWVASLRRYRPTIRSTSWWL